MELSDNLADWQWRITHLYKIKDLKRRLVYLHPTPIQQYLINQISADKKAGIQYRSTSVKPRQDGVSTLFLLYYLDDTIFHENTTSGILAHKWESLGYLFDIVKLAVKTMPDAYRPKIGDDSKTALSFPDRNSKIFVSLDIRSIGIHNLHISEDAFCEDERIRASLAAAGTAKNISRETTGNGVGNDAYETYQEAKAGINDYHGNFFPWPMVKRYRIALNGVKVIRTKPEHAFADEMKKYFGIKIDDEQILYRRKMIREQKKMAPQEFPENDRDCFLHAGQNFFDLKKAHVLLKEAKVAVEEDEPWEETEDYIAWEKPCKGDIYAAGADPAEGTDGDFSVLAIFNVTKRRQAFRFRAHYGVDAFSRICEKWGRAYNDALLAPERNNHGHAVILGLQGLKYPNLYVTKQETRHKISSGAVVSIGDRTRDRKYGWETTSITRPIMLDLLLAAVEGDSEEDEHNFDTEFLVLDQEFLKEVLSFELLHGKYQAAKGKHDDCIFAWGIAFQMYLKSAKYLSSSKRKKSDSSVLIGSERDIKI